jgi:hypothetical protein
LGAGRERFPVLTGVGVRRSRLDVVAVGLVLVGRVTGLPAGLLADFLDGLTLGLVRRTDGFLRIDLAPGLMLDASAGRVGSG